MNRVVKLALGLLLCFSVVACKTDRPAPQTFPTPAMPSPPKILPEIPKTTHNIALLVPKTGRAAEMGKAIEQATMIAFEDLQNPNISVRVYDTNLGAQVAASNAIRDGAKVILGPLFSQNVKAITPLAQQARVPVLTFSNDSSVAAVGVYVLGIQPDQATIRLVQVARAKGIRRIAAIIPRTPYGDLVSLAFRRAAAATNTQISALQRVSAQADNDELARAIERLSRFQQRVDSSRRLQNSTSSDVLPIGESALPPPPYDGLMIVGGGRFAASLVPILRQYRATNSNVRILGCDLWDGDPALFSNPNFVGAWYATVGSGVFESFDARFFQRTRSKANHLTSLAYDAMLLVGAAARNQWGAHAPFHEPSLRSSAGFNGVNGIWRFNNNVAQRGMEVREIRSNGISVIIQPSPTSFAPVTRLSNGGEEDGGN